jgi:hypothetical protein
MEENNSHGYIQEDVGYDDLIHSGGWPASIDQYAYQQPHTTQAQQYAPPYSNQPSFDHFDLQQSSYPQVSYTNSPYSSQSQYQHARPSDVFGPTSYNLDPSLQSSTAYPAEGPFSFGLHGVDNNTITPQSLQYQMPSAQPPVSHGVSTAAFQRSATDFSRPLQDPIYFNNTQNGNAQNTENSIGYPTLPAGSTDPESQQNLKKFGGPDDSSNGPTPRSQQIKTEAAQEVVRITHPELHAANNPSSRPRFQYAPFLSWEDAPIQVAPGLKSKNKNSLNSPFIHWSLQLTDILPDTLPKYHPRKSRSGKELVPGLDMSRKSRIFFVYGFKWCRLRL